MESNLSEKFIGKSPEEYGEKYHEHLLEQYKLYVEMADRVSERRQTANNYLLTVNSILVSLFGVLSGFSTLAEYMEVFSSTCRAFGFNNMGNINTLLPST